MAKKKEDWIQKAVTPEEKGKFGNWCKKNGFEKGVCQSCINKAIGQGGKPAEMANFAINVSKGKYKHPKKKAEILTSFIKLADTLDQKGLTIEAGMLDIIIEEIVEFVPKDR